MSYYYGSSSCADSGWFDSGFLTYSAGQLATDAFGIILSVVLGGLYLAVALSRRHAQRVAPWWLFGVGILFSLVAWILHLIGDTLVDCDVISDVTASQIWAPSSILFYGLAYLIWLAVLLFRLTLGVLNLANVSTKPYKFAFGGLYAVTFILWVAGAACTYYVQFNDFRYSNSDGRGYYPDLVRAYKGLNSAYTVLYFVSTLLAIALIIFSLTRLTRSRATTGLKVSLCVSMAFWLASNILSMVEAFLFTLHGWDASLGTIVAVGILDIFFLFGAAFAMLFAAGSKSWLDQTVPPPYRDGGLAYNGYGSVPVHEYQKPGPHEVSGDGRSTLYPYAPHNNNTAYVPPSELAGGVTASEVHGQPVRYEVPGHQPQALH